MRMFVSFQQTSYKVLDQEANFLSHQVCYQNTSRHFVIRNLHWYDNEYDEICVRTVILKKSGKRF